MKGEIKYGNRNNEYRIANANAKKHPRYKRGREG